MNLANQYTGDINEIKIYSLVSEQQIIFKAFLTDFSDSYTSNWNSEEIYGKMDPIYTFKNTIRRISIAFDVPSYNTTEATQNLNNSDLLIHSLYPRYNDVVGTGTANLGSPPLFRIKFANLIATEAKNKGNNGGLLGTINGYTFRPELESGFFFTSNKIIPKLFKVNFEFNVIHDYPLGYKKVDNTVTRRSSLSTIPGK